MIIRLLVLLVCLCHALGIYESQLGEYDWLSKNIGLVKDSVHSRDGERIYAITHDSVLVCLDTVKGNVMWRVVFPEDSTFENMVVSERDSKIYTLTSEPCGRGASDVEGCEKYSARAYELVNGVQDWQTMLTTRKGDDPRGLLDMVLVPQSRQIGVIAQNTFFNLKAADGSVLLTHAEKVSEVKLARAIPSDYYVALGCAVSSADEDATCRDAVLLKKSVGESSTLTTSTVAMPSKGIKASGLHAVIDSETTDGFGEGDAVFCATTEGISSTKLASGKKSSEHFNGTGSYSSRSGAVALQLGTQGKYIPAAYRCGLDGCQMMALGVDGALDLGSCDGSDAQVAVDRLGYSGHATTRLSCVASSDKTGVTAVVDAASAVHLAPLELPPSGQGLVFASAYSVSKKGGESRVGGILRVGSAGTTEYFTSKENAPVKVKWVRQEILSRIEDAVLVSRDHSLSKSTEINIMDFADSIIDGVDAVFDTIASTLLNKLGFKHEMSAHEKAKKQADKANHLVNQSRRFGFDKLAICVARGQRGLVILAFDVLAESVIWMSEVSSTERYLEEPTRLIKLWGSTDSRVSMVLSLPATGTRILELEAATGSYHLDTSIDRHTLNIFSVEGKPVLLTEGISGGERTVLALPVEANENSNIADLAGKFVYYADRVSGAFETYKMRYAGDGHVHNVCTVNSESGEGGTCAGHASLATEIVAAARFSPDIERIVDITTPTVDDVIASSTSSLSDDSVLLKYLNPNVCLVTTKVVGVSALYATLIDTVSAKIIYRSLIEGGDSPVSAALIENTISIFYWNSKAKRTEISSIHLYEGMIDKHGLTPFASKQSAANAQKHIDNRQFSNFLNTPPLAMQKTYVLPKAVTAVHHTVTAHGISNKNILVALSSGQIYQVDSRQLSPRRPMEQPSQHELMDGLGQFNPFVQLNPLQCITHNYSLGNGAKKMISAPSKLESSSMVFSFSHPDVHFNRVLPSADFDLLGADFNYPLLTLLLGIIGFGVNYMQNKQRANVIKKQWE